jgi:glycosyltransferase involved in cell wall biosynthesis
MKKILLLGDVNSAHIRKWATGIASLGFDTSLFSIATPDSDWYTKAGIRFFHSGDEVAKNNYSSSDFSKLSYLKKSAALKKIIKDVSPDVVHAHYATSYGILGALSGKHPFLVSFWGSDVFDFPQRSVFHRLFLKYVISRSDRLLSTSKVMKIEISKYTSREVDVTPFGIDLDEFMNFGMKDDSFFTIGIIKSLEDYYGIDNLIHAFSIVLKRHPEKKIRLMIVGDGPQRDSLKKLADNLGVTGNVVFAGKIPREEVPAMHNRFNLFVCPSLRESFGVSVLEASACEVPVIVTNVGGLPEVVQHNESGIVLKTHEITELADAICSFLDDPNLISLFGKGGRKFVKDNYDWNKNLALINDIYRRI